MKRSNTVIASIVIGLLIVSAGVVSLFGVTASEQETELNPIQSNTPTLTPAEAPTDSDESLHTPTQTPVETDRTISASHIDVNNTSLDIKTNYDEKEYVSTEVKETPDGLESPDVRVSVEDNRAENRFDVFVTIKDLGDADGVLIEFNHHSALIESEGVIRLETKDHTQSIKAIGVMGDGDRRVVFYGEVGQLAERGDV